MLSDALFPGGGMLVHALPTAGLFVLGALLVSLVLQERQRRRFLALIRAQWGTGDPERLRPVDQIAEWHRFHREGADPDTLIDDRTWDDLHGDALFQQLDHTQSRIGQQVLYHQLRGTQSDGERERFEAKVGRFTTDIPLRERVQLILAALAEPVVWQLWRLALPGVVPVNALFALVPLVPLAMLMLVIVAIVWAKALIFFVLVIFISVALRALLSWRLNVVVDPFRRLGQLFATADRLATLSGPGFADTAADLRRLMAPLRRLRWLAWWVGSGGSGDFISLVMGYLNLFLLLDFNALLLARRDLERHGPTLLLLMRRIGEIDAAQSIASWRTGREGWIHPVFVAADEPVRIVALRHPLLDPAVPHSLDLAPPHGILVTGSNMSGKSTLLRNVGIAAVMAQSVNTVLAESWRAPRFVIRDYIGRGDDLLGGKSYYLVEVERVLGMVRSAARQTPHLMLFDELFRGTNTVERIAAGEAVLREILRDGSDGPTRHVVIAATHDAELVDLLDGVYQPWHLSEMVDAVGLRFDYQLRPGPATSRNAIALLRLQGAPEAMVEMALARAAALDAARLTRDGALHA